MPRWAIQAVIISCSNEKINVDQNNTSQILMCYKSPDIGDQDRGLRFWDTEFLTRYQMRLIPLVSWPMVRFKLIWGNDSNWFGGMTWFWFFVFFFFLWHGFYMKSSTGKISLLFSRNNEITWVLRRATPPFQEDRYTEHWLHTGVKISLASLMEETIKRFWGNTISHRKNKPSNCPLMVRWGLLCHIHKMRHSIVMKRNEW